MPAEFIHVLCARDAFTRLDGPPIVLDEGAFNLGCQGPDIFSHNRRTKPLALAYARLLHRRLYGTFCADLARRVADEDRAVKSWFLGFVTHAAVDRALHPYIISKSSPLSGDLPPGIDRSRLHAFFERILDDCYGRYRRTGLGGGACRVEPVRAPRDLANKLAAPVAESLIATYGEKSGDRVGERVLNAFADADRVFTLTSSECPDDPACAGDLARLIGYGPGAVALLRPVGLSDTEDWLNLSHGSWSDPVTGEARRESAVDLAECAVMKAAEALRSAVNGERDLEAVIGNQCLSSCDAEGFPVPMKYASPFDLVPALLAQTELRKAQVLNRWDSVDRGVSG